MTTVEEARRVIAESKARRDRYNWEMRTSRGSAVPPPPTAAATAEVAARKVIIDHDGPHPRVQEAVDRHVEASGRGDFTAAQRRAIAVEAQALAVPGHQMGVFVANRLSKLAAQSGGDAIDQAMETT